MPQTVSVYQPRYFPRLHYLARVAQSDVFVIYDDVEFSRQSRQHRAQIEFEGAKWMTIPIKHTGNGTKINEAKIVMSQKWQKKHLMTVMAKYGGNNSEVFAPEYDALGDDAKLVDITIPILYKLIDLFGIETELLRSSQMDATHPGDPSEYLGRIVEEVGGGRYISGGTGYENYLDLARFKTRGIEVVVQEWTPEWPEGNVCALDVLFGAEDSAEYVK